MNFIQIFTQNLTFIEYAEIPFKYDAYDPPEEGEQYASR